MTSPPPSSTRAPSLDDQKEAFARRRFLAMPLAGAIMWTIAGAGGWFLSPVQAVWTLFICTGSTVYVGMLLSRFTGENLMDRSRPKNTFDSLFMQTVVMAMLVFAIAIPFFRQDHTSLPLSLGILAGLMWAPLSWMIEHWVGLFHAVGRTVLVLAAWYAFPDLRFVAVPAAVVVMYGITIAVLERRWRRLALAAEPSPALAVRG